MDSKSIAIIQDEIRGLGPPDPDVESAWLKEVERRAGEIESGQVKCVPAEEVFRQLDALLNPPAPVAGCGRLSGGTGN